MHRSTVLFMMGLAFTIIPAILYNIKEKKSEMKFAQPNKSDSLSCKSSPHCLQVKVKI